MWGCFFVVGWFWGVVYGVIVELVKNTPLPLSRGECALISMILTIDIGGGNKGMNLAKTHPCPSGPDRIGIGRGMCTN
jgi:hypothetical protein